jgi:hypothetical protein
MESHRRAALLRTRVKNFGQKWWRAFIVVFTLAVGIPSFYSYATWISVAPTGTIRSHEPLGTIFNVTNAGIFDLHHVVHHCDVTTGFGNNSFSNTFTRMGEIEGNLPAHATKSLDCEHAVLGITTGADIIITIEFKSPLWPFKRVKHFQFKSERVDDGTWVWKAQ